MIDKGRNRRIRDAAEERLVGGVDSPARAFNYVGGEPIPIERGSGSRVYDYDGNEYIDYALSFGAAILGHAHPEIVTAVKGALDSGFGFGATHASEVELAAIIARAIPSIEKIRFVSSGTEAVMGAVRLARGATGRERIIKFASSYHGHADYLLAKAGSGLATLGLPASAGVPADFTRSTIVAEWGDIELMERLIRAEGDSIAAIIVEPVGGNNGVVLPDAGFLKYLREATEARGILLIFDEVITGFRFHFGSAGGLFGIKPDITCLGKVIGGGLPIGAYGGAGGLMDNLAPVGKVYQASTFGGNPIVMTSGIAALNALSAAEGCYEIAEGGARQLTAGITQAAHEADIDIDIRRFRNMFSLHFSEKENFKYFFRAMLERGVYLAPSEYESNFISFAHDDGDIEKTINAARESFNALTKEVSI